MFEQVGAFLEGLVHVEEASGACGACDEVVAAAGEDDGGLVVRLNDARSDDAHYAAVPARVVEHERLAPLIGGVGIDAALCLFGGGSVEFLALHVVLVDVLGQAARDGGVVGEHEADGVEGGAYAAGGVDAGADEEDKVGDGEFLLEVSGLGFLGVGLFFGVSLAAVDMAVFEDGLDAGTRLGVEDAQSEVGEDAVLAHDGDDVAGDGDGDEVEVFQELEFKLFLTLAAACIELLGEVAEAYTEVLLEVGFDDFEADAAA